MRTSDEGEHRAEEESHLGLGCSRDPLKQRMLPGGQKGCGLSSRQSNNSSMRGHQDVLLFTLEDVLAIH